MNWKTRALQIACGITLHVCDPRPLRIEGETYLHRCLVCDAHWLTLHSYRIAADAPGTWKLLYRKRARWDNATATKYRLLGFNVPVPRP